MNWNKVKARPTARCRRWLRVGFLELAINCSAMADVFTYFDITIGGNKGKA